MKRFKPVKFIDVVINDSFWAPRIRVNRKKTLLHVYKKLKETGGIDAFHLDWKPGREPIPHVYWDSDVYKWVEAASYSLAGNPDPKLETLVSGVIHLIAKAQQPDGYVNVYFTAVEPEKRWTNLQGYHELYSAGHLFEAAVAHFQSTNNRKLLDVACQFADYIDTVFGAEPGKKRGYCGHPEIELALVKLYRATGEKRYLNLSRYFIDQRGQQPYYFEQEAVARGEKPEKWWPAAYADLQAHLPVRKQTEAVGHAVRAMYLYSAMADLAVETGDQQLSSACKHLWESACTKKMYLTGGIGSVKEGEKFGVNYDLPNEGAYAETCAAIGLVFWNHRMLQAECDSRYADVMERALYNRVISGVSLDGKKFFYDNPLASSGGHHRQKWFSTACCPPNVARLLASLGQYIYGQNEKEAIVHLYIQGSGHFNFNAKTVILNQQTEYPWDGKVNISLGLESMLDFTLKLRIPGWCRKTRVRVNNRTFPLDGKVKKGYLTIKRQWKNRDNLQIEFAMPVERIFSHPEIRQNAGKVALQRGPVVYCLEGVDNTIPLHRVYLPDDTALKTEFNKDLLGGVVVLKGKALADDIDGWKNTLYRTAKPRLKPVSLTAVPYCVWDNRKPGQMRVWLNRA